MVVKIEYFMESEFGKNNFYFIEYIDGDYYYSNNLITKVKLQREATEDMIQQILDSLNFIKNDINKATFNTSKGYINIQKSDGRKERYSNENHSFTIVSALLNEFNLKVMRLELEQ